MIEFSVHNVSNLLAISCDKELKYYYNLLQNTHKLYIIFSESYEFMILIMARQTFTLLVSSLDAMEEGGAWLKRYGEPIFLG